MFLEFWAQSGLKVILVESRLIILVKLLNDSELIKSWSRDRYVGTCLYICSCILNWLQKSDDYFWFIYLFESLRTFLLYSGSRKSFSPHVKTNCTSKMRMGLRFEWKRLFNSRVSNRGICSVLFLFFGLQNYTRCNMYTNLFELQRIPACCYHPR